MKKYSVLSAVLIYLMSMLLNDNILYAEEKNNSRIVLQLKWKHQFQFAGYYAASKMGFYNEENLDVRIVEGGYNKITINEVLEGRADYGVSNSEILVHRLKNKPVVVVAVIFQHSPLVFVSRKDHGISNPQEMIGKNIKFTKKTRDIELYATLLNEGVTFSKINHLEGHVKKEDYFDPNIDALSAYITNEPYYYTRKNIEFSIIKPVNYGVDFYGDCIFTTEKEVKNNPERVRAFKRASLKGWNYAVNHKDEIIDHIKSEYKIEKPLDHLKFEADAVSDLIMPNLIEIGHMNIGRWKHIADTFVKYKITPTDYSLDGFIFEHESRADVDKIKKSLKGFIFSTIIIFAAFIVVIFFNRRLQNEIKERRAAVLSLRESEEKFRNIFQQSSEGIILHDFKGTIIDANSAVHKIFLYTREELIRRNIGDFIIPQDIEKLKYAKKKLDSTGVSTIVVKSLKKDGTAITVESSAGVVYLSQEKVIMTIINDSTDKIEFEEKLKFQAMILDQIEDMVIASDLNGKVTYINLSQSELMGIQLNTFMGKDFSYYQENRKDYDITGEIIEKTLKNGEWRGETLISHDNKDFYLLTRTKLIYKNDNDPVGIVFINTDISDRKNAEKELDLKERQLRQAQKIEAVGTLAGGIAHDFNNLLYIISGNSELLLSKAENRNKKYIINILEATNRGADLVKRLLAFSRKTESKLHPVSLNNEITRIKKMLDRVIPKMINLNLQLEEKEKFIDGDQGQIEQVLINLCLNAKDFMPEGGDLTIETKHLHFESLEKFQLFEHSNNIPSGEYILLSVSDTGVGMDQKTKERIFDPFFTTKSIGKGSGLGLSVIYGIIQSHHGYIECKSEQNKGTTFNILFPVTNKIPGKLPDQKVVNSFVTGNETILVVDDEENIVKLTKSVLEKIGYRIFVENNAESALKRYKDNVADIDLIVLDLGMPGMGGKKAIDEFLKINPMVKIIVASGYAGEGNIRDTISKGVKDYIVKPFLKNDLATIIRKVLDESETEGQGSNLLMKKNPL